MTTALLEQFSGESVHFAAADILQRSKIIDIFCSFSGVIWNQNLIIFVKNVVFFPIT